LTIVQIRKQLRKQLNQADELMDELIQKLTPIMRLDQRTIPYYRIQILARIKRMQNEGWTIEQIREYLENQIERGELKL